MSKPVVAIVGRPNVGKSTFFNYIVGQRISIVEDTPGVTRDRVYAESNWRGRNFTVIDTAGIEELSGDTIVNQMREQVDIAISVADVIIFLTDVRQGVTADDKEIAMMLKRSKKPIVLVCNKADNFGDAPMEIYEFYNLGLGNPIPLSASNAIGVGDVLDAIYEKFPEENENPDEADVIKVAIIGKSGNGKSTIFNLLLRYFDATKGEILIDGVNIQDLNEASLRKNISTIRQSPFLFNLTIMENFRLVKKDVTLEEVREVCKKSYIDEYIMSLPKQYETIIGEGGVNLSGGQKQRLAIAGTLLINTKIILFDEATSALDNESQEYIKQTIDNLILDHTIVIVAHRLSTIMDADVIHVIDKGKLVASGTHKELLENSNIYRSLYTTESSANLE